MDVIVDGNKNQFEDALDNNEFDLSFQQFKDELLRDIGYKMINKGYEEYQLFNFFPSYMNEEDTGILIENLIVPIDTEYIISRIIRIYNIYYT